MTADRTSFDTRAEVGAVVGWRRGRLLFAGFAPDIAGQLPAPILARLDDDRRPC